IAAPGDSQDGIGRSDVETRHDLLRECHVETLREQLRVDGHGVASTHAVIGPCARAAGRQPRASRSVPPPTLSRVATYGLTSAEAARRLEGRPPPRPTSSLTSRAIVRRNLLTLFNLVLAACAVALIATDQLGDLLFAGVIVINSGIGIVQEIRAKRALDRLALLAAPRARVLRDGEEKVVIVDD